MSVEGWYYLHINGNLIFKPLGQSGADILESDFALAMWPMDPEDRMIAWIILVESMAFGADHARVNHLADLWRCDDQDAEEFARRAGIDLYMDGNAWCATGAGHHDLVNDPCGFGATKLEAMAGLVTDLGMQPDKRRDSSFLNLLKADQ